jgi:hypothetical protein
MDRLNRIAWLIIGLFVVAMAAFGVYLLLPAEGGDAGPDQTSRQASAPTSRDAQPSVPGATWATTTPSANLPLRRVQTSGVIEQVSGGAFTIRSDTGSTKRVVLRADAQMFRLTALPGPSAMQVGDAVSVITEAITRDPFRPPEDTGRVRVIRILEDGLPPGASPQCPQIGGRLGSVVAFEQGQLRLVTACGEQVLDVPPTTPVQRVSTAQPSDLKAGQRVAVGGEELPDGSISGALVQILDS